MQFLVIASYEIRPGNTTGLIGPTACTGQYWYFELHIDKNTNKNGKYAISVRV